MTRRRRREREGAGTWGERRNANQSGKASVLYRRNRILYGSSPCVQHSSNNVVNGEEKVMASAHYLHRSTKTERVSPAMRPILLLFMFSLRLVASVVQACDFSGSEQQFCDQTCQAQAQVRHAHSFHISAVRIQCLRSPWAFADASAKSA